MQEEALWGEFQRDLGFRVLGGVCSRLGRGRFSGNRTNGTRAGTNIQDTRTNTRVARTNKLLRQNS